MTLRTVISRELKYTVAPVNLLIYTNVGDRQYLRHNLATHEMCEGMSQAPGSPDLNHSIFRPRRRQLRGGLREWLEYKLLELSQRLTLSR